MARGDVAQRGVEAMRTVALSRLHRVGHSVTLQLGKLARALGPLAARSDEPYVEVVAGLRQSRPQFSRLLDASPGAGEGFRPFAEVADVRKSADALAVLAAQIVCVRDLLGVEPLVCARSAMSDGPRSPTSFSAIRRAAIRSRRGTARFALRRRSAARVPGARRAEKTS